MRYSTHARRFYNYKNSDLLNFYDVYQISRKIHNVLDIGCGNGEQLDKICKKFKARGVGLEIDDEVVEELTRDYPEYEFICGDAIKIDKEDDSFDLVNLSGVIEYLSDKQVKLAIREAIRVTNDFLVIFNFSPRSSFKNLNKHDSKHYVYHRNVDPLISQLGNMVKVSDTDWIYSNTKYKKIKKIDYFFAYGKKYNEIEGNTRKLTIYRKVKQN